MNKKLAVYTFVFFISYIAGISVAYPLGNKLKKATKDVSSPIVYEPPIEKTNTTTQEDVNPTAPKTEPCPLNGKLYSKDQRKIWEKRRPLGIMVENHKDSRPQSGLQNADIIYEAVAEGGITRFLAVYYCQDANPVGPVRSARVYFIQLLQAYGENPLYAHVGGANTPGPADALSLIKKLGWKLYNDLDQFSVPFPYFWRDYERLKNRAVEHTVYTSTAKLWRFAAQKRRLTDVDKKGIRWDESFTAWRFKDEENNQLGDAREISFGFWEKNRTGNYSVVWRLNPETRLYERENGGRPHIDLNRKKPLAFKTIIILFSKESSANDGYPGGHLLYQLKGKGEAIIFSNGKAEEATWSRREYTDNFSFRAKNGKEIIFERGKIFVEILPIGNKVEY